LRQPLEALAQGEPRDPPNVSQQAAIITELARRGFGMRLITDVLPAGPGGKATLSFTSREFVFELETPLSALVAT
jgi:hypothetical protein